MLQEKIFILSGPSGAGKTTLYERLLKDSRFKKIVSRTISVTTRALRGKEQNGKEYFFVSPKMFEYKIRAGHFIEYAKVFGNYYGTTKKEVRTILALGKNCLLCIDVQGAQIVKKTFKEAILIFIRTTNLQILKQRLLDRKTNVDKDVRLRLKTAKKELLHLKEYQYDIVNDQLESAYRQLCLIIEKETEDFK